MNRLKVKRNMLRIGLPILIIAVILFIYLLPSTSSQPAVAGVASLTKTFTEHNESIWKVQFSKDGHFIASCSIDSTVIVREKESGSLLAQLKHPAGVTNLAFSKDGNYIVTSSYDEKVRLWR